VSRALLTLFLLWISIPATAEGVAWFPELVPYVHAAEVSRSAPARVDFKLGLGALQKIGGRWRFKHEEQVDGELARYTWQMTGAYTAAEALDWWRDQLADAELIYQCRGRSCGSSAQWADLVFQERVLYGHEERQQYVVYRLVRMNVTYSLVLYAVDRANRRHYLHLDVLRHDSPD
jgi:hypothetical protein